MKETPSDEIDELLNRWADTHLPSDAALDQLYARVDESLGAERVETLSGAKVPEQLADSSPWHLSRLQTISLLATAAILLLAVAPTWKYSNRGSNPIVQTGIGEKTFSPESTLPIQALTAEQISDKANLLAELDRMFEGKRIWFAETESDVVLGQQPEHRDVLVAKSDSIVMRLVLAKRSGPSEPWSRVWSADVVAGNEQVVRFVSQDEGQPQASLATWAHMLPDGMIACDIDIRWSRKSLSDAELQRETHGTLDSHHLRDTVLISPDATIDGARLEVNGFQYQLFHSASLLHSS